MYDHSAVQVCRELLKFFERVSSALLPPKAALRRPEALGLRPLPRFGSLTDAKKVHSHGNELQSMKAAEKVLNFAVTMPCRPCSLVSLPLQPKWMPSLPDWALPHQRKGTIPTRLLLQKTPQITLASSDEEW